MLGDRRKLRRKGGGGMSSLLGDSLQSPTAMSYSLLTTQNNDDKGSRLKKEIRGNIFIFFQMQLFSSIKITIISKKVWTLVLSLLGTKSS